MKSDNRLGVMMLLAIAGVGMGWAQSPGTFSATGAMTTPRQKHTATLLPSGMVLIAGGYQLTTRPDLSLPHLPAGTGSAELYDSDTGTFTATGNMTAVRYGHTATLLADGRVLIAGGTPFEDFSGSRRSALPSAELYDPLSGTFTPTGSMAAARAWHTATLLPNGKVLIAGGRDGGTHYSPECMCTTGDTATAELYDPVTGTFSPTGDMTAPLAGPIATLLSSGKVWITTGEDGPNLSARLYDPETGTFSDTGWQDVGSLIAATVNLLINGQLLITLNASECDFNSRSAGLYDLSTQTFRDAGQMAYAICRPTGVMLSDGFVLITGGFFIRGGPAQIYDPFVGKFSLTGEMITGRVFHTATLLRNGSVLIAGGCTGDCETTAGAELYAPPSRKPAPALLTIPNDRPEQGAILHAGTSQVVSPSNPTRAGEVLEIYCTGLLDGSVIPPQIAIGGRMSEVLFFGKTPGYAGLNQVNVRVPSGIAPGSAVPVRLNYIGRPSNEVTIGVR